MERICMNCDHLHFNNCYGEWRCRKDATTKVVNNLQGVCEDYIDRAKSVFATDILVSVLKEGGIE